MKSKGTYWTDTALPIIKSKEYTLFDKVQASDKDFIDDYNAKQKAAVENK